MGSGKIVSVTLLDAEGSLVSRAVMVTVLPIGTCEGAVNTAAAPLVVCVGANVPQAPAVVLPVSGFP